MAINDYDDYKNKGRNSSYLDNYTEVSPKVTKLLKSQYFGILIIFIFIGLFILLPIKIVSSGSKERNTERQLIQAERNIKFSDINRNMEKYIIKFPTQNIPYNLKDKRIIIIENAKLAESFYDLPEKNQAINDNEIDYIVQLDRENIKVGTYTSGGNAYQIIYIYDIVDYKNNVTVHSNLVKGSDPPRTIRGYSGSGSNPIGQVITIINNLLDNNAENIKGNL